MQEPLMLNVYQKYNFGRDIGTSNINIYTYDNSLRKIDKNKYINKI